MKNRFLRTFLILLLIAVLAAGGVYAAARYGSQDDPLITLSYLTDVAEQQITDQTETSIRTAVSNAQAQMQDQLRDAAGVYQPVNLSAGQTLNCDPGTEILLTGGAAVMNGAGSDVTVGSALASGVNLPVNHLCLAGSDGVTIQTDASAALMLRGGYSVG